ncbi:phosphoglycerate mutase-like protein [Lophiostoma macrostomum CBS 122681]|uniref:Phosphoglycerate mutase-like protein n=1 Tax=Lophiostoma macrostomum CBS 122681 TaxID=1314788 RepID=A0A6A6TN96_9PLEO|nr:phosphoglycerate mutase-like protein [Lophiostoma macrostomum CBS 122681]
MLALFLAITAAICLIEAAQTDDNPSYNPHGSVVFVRSGERTPLIAGSTQILSALGAQQMHDLGSAFRGRYILGSNASTVLGTEPINTLMPNILDPDQLYIQALDTPYLISSAQAFMQGFYPPYSISNGENGAVADATGLLANGTFLDFPLGGYQYAPVDILSEYDQSRVFIAGDQGCPISQIQSNMYLATPEFLHAKAMSEDFYDALPDSMFSGQLSDQDKTYFNAIEIYEYLSYQYTHDSTVFDTLANDSTFDGVYENLRFFANEMAWYKWGNTSGSSSDMDYQAMAGKTVAARLLGLFQDLVDSKGNYTGGASHPLSIMFGEHQSFISLFSLMMLDFVNPTFRALPPFASAMVFELYSTGDNTSFPDDTDDLWVSFYFQNGTDFSNNQLIKYPIFGLGPSNVDMRWMDFQNMMSRIMLNTLTDWCEQCSSSALFCTGVDSETIAVFLAGNKKPKVTPQVAGVIGAVVTLAVAALIFALAVLVGGIRFHRVEPSRKSDLGGFKGSAKLASDADLNLPRNGAPPAGIVSFGGSKKGAHERVGSWELRQKEFGKGGDIGDESRRGSFDGIGAVIERPVEPTERV